MVGFTPERPGRLGWVKSGTSLPGPRAGWRVAHHGTVGGMRYASILLTAVTLAPSRYPGHAEHPPRLGLAAHANCTNVGPFYAAMDTMKESWDTDRYPLTPVQIADDVDLSATLNVNYITVDTFWDYPAYMQEWVNAGRATGKHVWFRVHPNAWEGDNGMASTMTPLRFDGGICFYRANPHLFEPGDILDMNPEPEDSPYWARTYGQNWPSNRKAVTAYNRFSFACRRSPPHPCTRRGSQGSSPPSGPPALGSQTTLLSSCPRPSPTWAGEGRLVPGPEHHRPSDGSSGSLGGAGPDTAAYPGVPIVEGEFGYSNAISVDDITQAKVIRSELDAISPDDCIQGLSYWVGAGTNESGGYTHLFAGFAGDWSLRPAARVLSSYFEQKRPRADRFPLRQQ